MRINNSTKKAGTNYGLDPLFQEQNQLLSNGKFGLIIGKYSSRSDRLDY